MVYSYWSTIIFIMLVFLLLLRKVAKSKLSHRTLLIAWKIALLRASISISIPSLTSIYNWLNPRLSIQENPLVRVTYTAGDTATEMMSKAVQKPVCAFDVLEIIGVCLFLLVVLIAALKSFRLIKSSRPCTDVTTLRWVQRLSRPFRRIVVLHSENISAPMSCNFGIVAYILIPLQYVLTEENAPIFTHEFIHIKRHDTFWKTLSLFVLCYHWFNPVVWVLVYVFSKEIELSCDENVIQLHGSQVRSKYAHDLVNYSCSPSRSIDLLASFKSKNIVEERVKNIMNFSTTTRLSFCIGTFLVVASSICFSTNAFVGFASREPLEPDPVAMMATDEEMENKALLSGVKYKRYSIEMVDGIVHEHDIRPEEMMIYINDGEAWTLAEGQQVILKLHIVDRKFPYGQQTEVGYIVDGQEYRVFADQIKNGMEITFIAPENNDYYFFIKGRSSDTILVNDFSVTQK